MASDQVLALMALTNQVEPPLKIYNKALRRAWRTETDSPENKAAQERGNAALLVFEQEIRRWVAQHPDPRQPASHAERRDQFAKVIYERWNPGASWTDAHPDDRVAYGADADVAMAAADSVAGIPYADPTRTDIYREVADRLAALGTKSTCEWARTAASQVRTWADGGPQSETEAAATLARECVDRPAVIRWCADRVRSTDGDYAVQAAAEYLDDLATEIDEAAAPAQPAGRADSLPAGFRSAVVIAVKCAVCEYEFDEDESYTVHFDTVAQAHQVLRDHGWTVLDDGRSVCDSDQPDHNELRSLAQEERDERETQAHLHQLADTLPGMPGKEG